MKKGKASLHGNARRIVDSTKMKPNSLFKEGRTKPQEERMKAVESQLKNILQGASDGGGANGQAESVAAGATQSSMDNIESMAGRIKEIVLNLTKKVAATTNTSCSGSEKVIPARETGNSEPTAQEPQAQRQPRPKYRRIKTKLQQILHY